jgi:hypothetical protein
MKAAYLRIMLCGVLCGLAIPAAAQEFRMDTDVFLGTKKEPISETLTIFSGTMVYDFLLTAPREIVVFDAQRGTFTLLDETRKVKTTVTTEHVLAHAFALKEQAAQSPDSLFAFASDPKFTETVTESEDAAQATTTVRLEGKLLTYEAKGQRPKFPEAATAYKQFATWYARLNAKRPGNLPPEARTELNRALADRGLVPLEITRTVAAGPKFAGKKSEVRSRHLINYALSGEDQKRLERAHDMLVNFPAVSWEEYNRPADAKSVAKK